MLTSAARWNTHATPRVAALAFWFSTVRSGCPPFQEPGDKLPLAQDCAALVRAESDARASTEQLLGELAADEACSASYEDFLTSPMFGRARYRLDLVKCMRALSPSI
jgi:hypothetical protein